VHHALAYIGTIASNEFIRSDTPGFLTSFVLIIPFVAIEWWNRRSTDGVIFSGTRMRPEYRMIVELVLALLIVDCFYTLNHEQFIYFQF
jgi:hypothetical protein